MAKKISFKEFIQNIDFYLKEAEKNKIFVYPTDTIYGIGAINNLENILKIANIKQRDPKQLMSVMAPDFDWIIKNYSKQIKNLEVFGKKSKKEIIGILTKHLDSHHGITYIFDYNISGVRIIKHPFQDFVKKIGSAFISTSLNISGSQVINETSKIPKEIENQVDYIIDDGKLSGKASVLIDFVAQKEINR